MADLVKRRTACMCQDVEIGSHAVSVGLKLPSHMQDYSAARVASGLSPDIAVDACLVGEIRTLWSKGIRTYGCCCGHNKVRGMINVHEDDAEAMHAMGYEQWPTEEGYHPWTFYPRSTRADAAALEAEASEGERRGLERAAEVADAKARLLPEGTQRERVKQTAGAIRALIPEAPVREGWMPIETAPKDGARVLAYRADQGVFICRWTTMEEVVPKNSDGDPSENYDEDFEGWFHLRWGWLENEEAPTHWRPIPAPPQDNREG